jgi:diguanylate cyclase (GGDEF)-like protein
MAHEIGIIERLTGIAGVARLAAVAQPGAIVLVDDGGVALADVIRAQALDVPSVVAVALQLTRTIATMHARGVVHKDISPANVLLAGPGHQPVIVDFDLANTFAVDRPGFVHQRDIVGTLAYLPPEQTGRTGLPVDHRADLYALAATLYEVIAGRPPFEGTDELQLIRDILVKVPTPLAELRPDVPPMLSEIVARLLEKDPDRRYQSAGGVTRDLMTVGEQPDVRFELGRWDFPIRLSAPSRLIGRDAEIDTLLAAFRDSLDGPARGVLVGGAPGVGKSALMNELRRTVAAEGGWFVSGKSDQFRHDAAAGGILQALRGLGRLLLAEPEDTLVAARHRLVEALSSNLGLVTNALPEFATLLAAGPDLGTGDARTAEPRLQQAVLHVLRNVVSPTRPLIMVVDDLQWADPVTLGLFDAVLTDPDLRGLLVVGAFRNQEIDAAHPLAARLKRWERLGVSAPPMRLENLPPTQASVLLAEMLRLPPGRAAALADAVQKWTAGNPYDTIELINTLRRDDVLVLTDDGWSWDGYAIHRYVGHGDVVDMLKDRIAGLPEVSRMLLHTMACLSSDARLDLLAAAVGLPVPTVGAHLVPPLEDGLLIMDQDGGGVGDRCEPAVRFRHDRVQQAAFAGLDQAGRSVLRLAVARRLAGSAATSIESAEQYLATAETIADPAELADVVRLYRAAAANAWRCSNYRTAEHFLSAAADIMDTSGTELDNPARVDVEIERHTALHCLGLLADADVAYASIARRTSDPIALAAPACAQISSLTQRNRGQDALAVGAQLLARLGQPVPGPDFAAEIPARLEELLRWAARLDLAGDLSRPEITDPRVIAVARLFSRLLPTAAFLGESALVAWIVLECQRMWAHHGPSAGLGANLGCVSLVIAPRLQDFRTGYLVGRHVLAVGEARGYEPETSVLRHRYALQAMHWVEPLENSVVQAQLARDGLLRGGDLALACHTSLTLLAAQLDCSHSLETYAAEINGALVASTRTASHHSEMVAVAHRQLVRALRGETDQLGGFDDDTFSQVEHLAGLANNPLEAGIFHVYRSLSAALFADTRALARHSADAMALWRFVPGYSIALAHLLRALSLADQIRSAAQVTTDMSQPAGAAETPVLLAELDACRAWLAARSADAPANFRHLLRLVDAERAWAVGDFRTAITAFDEASQETGSHPRPWHRAFVAERAGTFYLEHGLPRAGRPWLSEARSRYAAWGATAKVADLDSRHPSLRPVERMSTATGFSDRSRTISAESIDMLAILRASQALSSETNLDRLRLAIDEHLAAITGATEVVVVLRNDDTHQWFLPGCGRTGGVAIGITDDRAAELLPIAAFRYAERTREPLLVEDAAQDDRFAHDPYFAGMDRCSLLVVPVQSQGMLRAILLLTNGDSSRAFTIDRLDAVMLITGQLAVSISNAMLYSSLENRVVDRTRELAAANEKLEILSTTDALTGLANRRRLGQVLEAEWRRSLRAHRPVGLAMVDIDFFKPYNDHYGHVAGDLCLSKVAQALADAVRAGVDMVCRYGGEEFVIVMPEADASQTMVVAERARRAIAELELPHLMGGTGTITVSIGTASTIPTPSTLPEALVRRADAALYEAKESGRNQVRGAMADDGGSPAAPEANSAP